MKTSNIIATIYLTLVFSGVLALYVAARDHDITGDENHKKIVLPAFSVIVGNPGSEFSIEECDTISVTLSWSKNQKMSPMPCVVRNDTLFMTGRQSMFKHSFEIRCNKVHTIIAGAKSIINVRNFNPKSLTLLANGGEINFWRGRNYWYDGTRVIGQLSVVAKDSGFVDLGNIKVQCLKVDISRSKLESSSIKTKSIDATIRNNSKIDFHYSIVDNMQVSTDSTSFFSLNKYRQ